jgi:phosphoglycerate dehydrogenase-like enzyme
MKIAIPDDICSTVQGKTIGIWGYGKIGKMIAGYAIPPELN